MLYLGHGSSVTHCPLCEAFAPVAVSSLGLPVGSVQPNLAGGVKIIDMFALGAVLAVQSRRAQIIECTVEFGFDRGVNELDMGEGVGALWVCAAPLKWRLTVADGHAFGRCRGPDAPSAGART